MILNNFSNLCACLNQNPEYYQRDMNFKDAAGLSPNFSSGYNYITPTNGGIVLWRLEQTGSNLTQTPTWYIFLGKGTTPPSPSDYNFETAIEGASYTSTNASFVRAGTKLIYSAVINNTGSSSFSFSEVALGNWYNAISGGKSTTVLLTRDVISPVTVEAGKSKTVTVVIDFAAMATSVA